MKKEDKKPNIKILVACHKADPNIRQDDIYMPIHVGKALHPDFDLGFQGDNTGDNISEKNPNYCELTALYWAWKNLKNIDYIGLCHYRRYFDFNYKGLKRKISSKTNNINWDKNNDYLKSIVDPDTIIISKKEIYPNSLIDRYSIEHNRQDIYKVFEIIKKDFPNYINDFEFTLAKENHMSPYNMFIMKWEDFDEYCTFLFSVLGKLEECIDIRNYNQYQKRIYGFISERLLNVYVNHKKNSKVIKYKPVVTISEDHNSHSLLHQLINALRFNLSFKISRTGERILKSKD